jgi:hypothetical protein
MNVVCAAAILALYVPAHVEAFGGADTRTIEGRIIDVQGGVLPDVTAFSGPGAPPRRRRSSG